MSGLAARISRTCAALRAYADAPLYILMSGGVDSTAAALLALSAGLRPLGVTMRNAESTSAIREAASACDRLDIPALAFDLREDFERLVAHPFREAYLRGETPNPCTICNPAIKFGLLWERIAEHARRSGENAFRVMSGHYAITRETPHGVALWRGTNRAKDQSYFLCMLPIMRVERLVLPLGEYEKHETREIVRALSGGDDTLRAVAEKPESMDICFHATADYRSTIADSPGPILDPTGRVVGNHKGISRFTLGQRRGLGIASTEPLFVIEIRAEERAVVVGTRAQAMTREVRVRGVNVLAPDAYGNDAALCGKIRSQMEPAPCRISIRNDEAVALFDAPVFAPAAGQYLALYDGERLAAGGRIVRP